MNTKKILLFGGTGLLTLALLIWGIGYWLGSHNVHTPAGNVGYVHQRAWFGEARFINLQTGPTSSGLGWLYHVVNVPIRPFNDTEEFTAGSSVLSKDDLQIGFRLHVTWRVRQERIKQFVEEFSQGTMASDKDGEKLAQEGFQHYLKEPIRTYARDGVQKRTSNEIKQQMQELGEEIGRKAKAKAEGTPYEILDVVIGNIQYPAQVSEAVALRLKTEQDLKRMDTELEIENKKRERRVTEAKGIAEAMDIISSKLTSNYLQYLAIEAQKSMVGSPNHTTVYIPSGQLGMPLVGTIDASGKMDNKK